MISKHLSTFTLLNLNSIILQKLELNQMENLEGGRRFWGKEYDMTQTECFFGIAYAPYTQFILGIEVGSGIERIGTC